MGYVDSKECETLTEMWENALVAAFVGMTCEKLWICMRFFKMAVLDNCKFFQVCHGKIESLILTQLDN